MLRKSVVGMLFALGLAFNVAGQEVVVTVKPPHAVEERRPVSPGRDYVWIGGYHRWDGRAYVWVPGRWERPPHRHAHWVAHHWVKRHGGWVLIEGHWA